MADRPGTAGRYTVQHIPASHDSAGVENWRVTDPEDNRVATCYYETNARMIADALNGAAAVGPGDDVRLAGSINGDPYACGGFTFADHYRAVHNRADPDFLPDGVTVRVFDDVHAAHRMLDALDSPPGPLTARIGLAFAGVRTTGLPVQHPAEGSSILDGLEAEARRYGGQGRRRSEPLSDPDDVKIPTPDEVLGLLDRLTAEEAFRVFDYVKVLPADGDVVRSWVLTDSADVRDMITACCTIALETDRLQEVAKAAVDALARRGLA